MTTAVKRHQFEICLAVRSPFLFRTIDAQLLGFDEAQLTDLQGRALLPGDQLRGVLRAALKDFPKTATSPLADPDAIFGSKSEARTDIEEGDTPARGKIIFSDLIGEDIPAADEKTRPAFRVAIDDMTGAASTGALQVMQQIAPPAQIVRFRGTVIFFGTDEEAETLKKLLKVAIGLTPSIGALKSAGFGEIVHDQSELKSSAPSRPLAFPQASAPVAERHVYDVYFDRPVLVDAERLAGNVFKGSTVIPGAVLKGAVARRLELSGVKDTGSGSIGRALAAMRFSHAFPHEAGERGMPALPLSLVARKGDEGPIIRDALHLASNEAALIHGEAPLYTIDWKGDWYSAGYQACGLHEVSDRKHSARTRTAIDDDVASTGRLFTAISCHASDEQGKDLPWRMSIDIADVDAEDRAAAGQIIAALEQGLDGIGKTTASARFVAFPEPSLPRARPFAGEPGTYAIMLRTAALMLDLDALHDEAGNWKTTPEEAYRDYWSTVLPGSEMSNFFATQKLAGGYLAHRRRLYGSQTYYPFLLTMPGSVFLLKGADEERVNALLHRGLPVCKFADTTAEAVTWNNCPFVPENGYGEIVADYLSDPTRARTLREGVSHV
ncbi:RAMP superfamily CRISPR-associated protein [Breoghania sp.]|uniref:RAMP superfamily CRISPR-associated protein n=1 Tax=Breoghania sp. TaxID=2065378 RepID=UPI002AA7457E|nr:RAMP superfamily CRISPR-associated protein [Breoghania sp.]